MVFGIALCGSVYLPRVNDPASQRMKQVAAILLAAGRSERMGAFKPLLPFGDSTVIESCIDYLRQGGVNEIVVVVGHRAGDIRKHLQGLPIKFAINPDPASEMGVSIACGVKVLTPGVEAILIALVDHPAISPAVVSTLVSEWRKGASLVIPITQNRGGHPVLVDLNFRHELLNLDSSRGLKGLFENHRDEVIRVPVKSPYIDRDMDTWDDYSSLHKEVFGKWPPSPF